MSQMAFLFLPKSTNKNSYIFQGRTSGGGRAVVGLSRVKVGTLSDFSAELGIGHVVCLIGRRGTDGKSRRHLAQRKKKSDKKKSRPQPQQLTQGSTDPNSRRTTAKSKPNQPFALRTPAFQLGIGVRKTPARIPCVPATLPPAEPFISRRRSKEA